MKSIFLAVVIVFYFLSSPFQHQNSYKNTYNKPQEIQSELSEKLLRLHVIAASDSDEDQAIKMCVKDETITILKNLLSTCNQKEVAIASLSTYIPELEKSLQDFLTSINCSQHITISLEYTYFPIKFYGDLVFPAGYYDALRIVLNEGQGRNWWCVLYPPLCFTDVCTQSVPEESKVQLQDTISDEAWNGIQVQTKPKIRFWIVDWIQKYFF